jgi:coproporphyrinogen III oxidase-like Fe-S oxidoreductase
LGPSAASRFFKDGCFLHRKQIAALGPYLEFAHRARPEFEHTTRSQTVLEAVFLEMRKNVGVQLEQFSSRYGYDIRNAEKFSEFLDAGFVALSSGRSGEYLTLTPKGRLLADTVCERLVDI